MATQAASRFVKLIMVTGGANNNKYYEMTYDGHSSTFDVKYGRVESTAVTKSYPIDRWDKTYREKTGKGYKDVTAYVTTEVVANAAPEALGKIAESKVEEFMSLMKRYTDGLVAKTYSVVATSVTQAQVDSAQTCINTLLALDKTNTKFQRAANDLLLELYTIIPRRMGRTEYYLLPSVDFDVTMDQEQTNLDAMAGQVAMLAPKAKKGKASKAKKETKTLLDVLGISMSLTKTNADVDYLIKQVGGRTKVEAIFKVNKPAEDAVFESWVKKAKNKDTRILIHGTKCTSVIPILEIGLKIRPAGNFQFSGKVYGDGNYFSEVVQKSLNYTGNDSDKILLVYEVHTGNPFVYQGWYNGNSFPLTFKELSSRGFDSTYVKAGGGLLNSEIIAYSENQNRLKYIIWLKS